MKGHVPTPTDLAEQMVRRLFRDKQPRPNDRILYPGVGTGPFAAAVEHVCDNNDWAYPTGLGVELNPEHIIEARDLDLNHAEFVIQDFLDQAMLDEGDFEYIIGNPPYVPIEGLDKSEKQKYKAEFDSAIGRFDLYILFFERAIDMLAEDGILSFVTPEKYEYVDTATSLREILTRDDTYVEEILHIDENAFKGLVTFPAVTTVRRGKTNASGTIVKLRDGSTHTTNLPQDGNSWASSVRDVNLEEMKTGATLGDITIRISPGMATGADAVFVMDHNDVPNNIDSKWIRRTVAGRQLSKYDGPYSNSVFLCPYDDDGSLPEEDELGSFGNWARKHRDRLENRSCVKKGGKNWYAWHETPPMKDILQPKIVFKDIAGEPKFWPERDGDVIPKHTVYYLVPKSDVPFDELLEYLNSSQARMWMEAHCQKAANGFYRLQSRVLTDLPVPAKWSKTYQATL